MIARAERILRKTFNGDFASNKAGGGGAAGTPGNWVSSAVPETASSDVVGFNVVGIWGTSTQPLLAAAEGFRMIRTNLEFMSVDADIKSLVITSCIQGEAKSVSVTNLAAIMAVSAKKVVVVDGDLRRPRLHTYFGVENKIGVSTVASGKTALAAERERRHGLRGMGEERRRAFAPVRAPQRAAAAQLR